MAFSALVRGVRAAGAWPEQTDHVREDAAIEGAAMGRDGNRVTIGDVAARAEVSVATVSRVMNGRYGVSKSTTRRVQGIVDELGYESSLVARSLRSVQTNVIGVLVPGIDSYGAELLKGASAALQDSGYELVVYAGGMNGEDDWEQRSLSRLSGTLTDGIVLVAPTVRDVRATHPVVAIDSHVGGSSLPTINSHNAEGAGAATQHLLDLGHRRIGFIGGRTELDSSRRREDGYRDALLAAGIPIDPDLMQPGDFTEEGARDSAETLLAMSDRPTAIFASNDRSAIQVMRSASQLGLVVPEDLSVVGFDNVPMSALVDPPLTTVDQSLQDIGAAAVRALLDIIREPDEHGERDPIRTMLPTRLVVRASTAAPR